MIRVAIKCRNDSKRRNDVKLLGAVIEIDNASGKAVSIQRVSAAI
jgi:hypothetical protein